MKKKYKKRYVLGEGYPYWDGYGVFLDKCNYTYQENIELKIPKEFRNSWKDEPHVPKYRLVLERTK